MTLMNQTRKTKKTCCHRVGSNMTPISWTNTSRRTMWANLVSQTVTTRLLRTESLAPAPRLRLWRQKLSWSMAITMHQECKDFFSVGGIAGERAF